MLGGTALSSIALILRCLVEVFEVLLGNNQNVTNIHCTDVHKSLPYRRSLSPMYNNRTEIFGSLLKSLLYDDFV